MNLPNEKIECGQNPILSANIVSKFTFWWGHFAIHKAQFVHEEIFKSYSVTWTILKNKISKIISLLQVDARYFTHRTIATHRWKGNIRRYRWTSMWEKHAWIECAVATTADQTKAQFIDGIVQVAWNADIVVESSSRVLWLMFDVGISQLVALTGKLRSISQFPVCYKYSALAIWYRILWPDRQKYRVPMHFGMRRALCYAHVCGLRHSIHSVCGHT